MSFYVKAKVKNKDTVLYLSSNQHKLTKDEERRAWFMTTKEAGRAAAKARKDFALVFPWLSFSVAENPHNRKREA